MFEASFVCLNKYHCDLVEIERGIWLKLIR